MKLSIVIPAYNEEKVIGPCLEAVIADASQHAGLVEIVVVNNASTDRTAEIVGGYQEVKLVTESRKGLLFARQAGFESSTGELIANIDADTLMPSGWIGKVLREFEAHPQMSALSGPYIYYDVSIPVNAGVWFFYLLGYLSHLVAQHIFHRGAMMQGGNFILRRSALEKVGGYNLELSFYGEDTDMAVRMQRVGLVKFSFFLVMPTSGRRLKDEGVLRMGMKYAANYIWPILFGRAFTQEYKDIRK
jgi:glycosyltransferase involved in cell wall biosynthesis